MSDKKRSKELKKLTELIAPSAFSSIVCVVASLVISLGTLFVSRYRPGRLILETFSDKSPTIGNSSLLGSLTQSRFIEDLPTICFVIVVGLLIYFLVHDIRKQKTKVPSKRFIKHLAIRLIAAGLTLHYLYFFFNHLLNYSSRVVIFSGTASNVIAVSFYLVLSVIITSIGLHINVLLLRLVALKTRLIDI